MIRPKPWAGFRSVLCPIDFSEHSRRALQYAVAVASRGRASLTAFYVNDPLLMAAALVLHDRQLAKRSESELDAFVDATVPARARTALRLTTGVATGDPGDQILKAARRHRTDLIVLGAHGLMGADRVFMGSTTLSVLQGTHVPVLAIPRDGLPPRSPVSRSWPRGRIVAAVESVTGPAREVERAARIAQWFGRPLLLAHVAPAPTPPAWMSIRSRKPEDPCIGGALRQLRARAGLASRRVATDVHVAYGRVADELSALCARERTELLLTALHDRRRWLGAKRGSMSYQILLRAVITPVLAWPPEWRPR